MAQRKEWWPALSAGSLQDNPASFGSDALCSSRF